MVVCQPDLVGVHLLVRRVECLQALAGVYPRDHTAVYQQAPAEDYPRDPAEDYPRDQVEVYPPVREEASHPDQVEDCPAVQHPI